jgi:hypothetical protein
MITVECICGAVKAFVWGVDVFRSVVMHTHIVR